MRSSGQVRQGSLMSCDGEMLDRSPAVGVTGAPLPSPECP